MRRIKKKRGHLPARRKRWPVICLAGICDVHTMHIAIIRILHIIFKVVSVSKLSSNPLRLLLEGVARVRGEHRDGARVVEGSPNESNRFPIIIDLEK